MKTGSIWYDEIYVALFNLLNKILPSVKASGKEYKINVITKTPNFTIDKVPLPCIVLSDYNEKFDQSRFTEVRNVLNTNSGNKTVTLDSLLQPYRLFFQIDLWSNRRDVINQMTRKISYLGKRYNLEVKDSNEVVRHTDMVRVDFAEVDEVEEDLNTRYFHRVFSFRISAELDEGSPIIKPIVTEPNLNIREES